MNYTKENKIACNLNELKVNEDSINGKKITAFEGAKKITDTNRQAARVTLEDGKTYTSFQLVKLGVKVEGEKKPRTEGGKKNEAKLHEKEIEMLNALITEFGEKVTVKGLRDKLQKAQDDDEAQKAKEREEQKAKAQKEKDEKKAQKKIEGVDDDVLLAVAAKRLGLSVEALKAMQTANTEGAKETEKA